MPFFSIILPTYNQAYFLKKSIKSIIAQTYNEWELLIIDNNSTDNTKKVIKSFNDVRIKYFKINNKNILARSRNLGIKKSTSEWISFIDSDDQWYPNKLEEVKKIIDVNVKIDLIYHDLVFSNKKKFFTKKILDKSRSIKTTFIDHVVKYGNPIGQSSVVVKKNILKKINYISENKKKFSWEDFDTWIRISLITKNIIRIPKTLGSIWIGPENLSNLDRQIINNKNIYECYKHLFKKSLNKLKYQKIWWMEYPVLLKKFREKKYQECIDLVNEIKNVPIPNVIDFVLIKYFSFLKIYYSKIKKLFTIIILFKKKSVKINKILKENVKIIINSKQLKNIKFKNFIIPKSFEKRLKNKCKLYYLSKGNYLKCYGWSTKYDHMITEIDCKIDNKRNIILFDFMTLSNFRNKGYYSKILHNILKINHKNHCYIYTSLTNYLSIRTVLKNNFKINKILFYLDKKIFLNY